MIKDIDVLLKNELTRESLKELDKTLNLIPLTFDYAFKKVFGNNEKLLGKFVILILNNDFDLKLDIDDCHVELKNPELPKENYKEYRKTVDVYVVLNKKVHIDIEVNGSPFKKVQKRNFKYADKLSSMILETGEDIKELKYKYLYQINLNTSEKKIDFGDDVIVPYGLKSGTVYDDSKKIVLKYLEYYRHLYYNKNIRDEEVIWLTTLTSTSFTELYDLLSQILSSDERDTLIKDVIRMSNDNFSIHEWEKEKLDKLVEMEGLDLAREEGYEQGSKNEKLEIARNMIAKGTDIEYISEVTCLTKEEIEKLK